MRLSSPKYGKNISPEIEVVNISSFGFWLYANGREFFLSFTQFPWFRQATIDQICHVEREQGDHFHWPELDIDLNLERIEHPEKYPLIHR